MNLTSRVLNLFSTTATPDTPASDSSFPQKPRSGSDLHSPSTITGHVTGDGARVHPNGSEQGLVEEEEFRPPYLHVCSIYFSLSLCSLGAFKCRGR